MRGLIYVQIFFWFWFYDFEGITKYLSTRQFEIIFYWFAIAASIFFRLIMPDFRFGHYTGFVISVYIYITAFAFHLYSQTFEYYKAASLAFMTTFLTSVYWEFVLHVGSWNQGAFDFNQVVQMLHFLPAIWLLKRFKYDKNHAINWLALGVLISFVISVFVIDGIQYDRMAWLPISIYNNQALKAQLYAFNRVFCGGVLMVVIRSGVEKKRGIAKVIEDNKQVFDELARGKKQ